MFKKLLFITLFSATAATALAGTTQQNDRKSPQVKAFFKWEDQFTAELQTILKIAQEEKSNDIKTFRMISKFSGILSNIATGGDTGREGLKKIGNLNDDEVKFAKTYLDKGYGSFSYILHYHYVIKFSDAKEGSKDQERYGNELIYYKKLGCNKYKIEFLCF